MSARMSHDESRRERPIAALVALGGFALLCGGVFLLPFLLSPYAIQNDVYMSNLFLAPLIAFGGVLCLLVAAIGILTSSRLRGLRWVWLRPLAMAVVGAGAVAVAAEVVGGRYESFPPGAISWPPYLNASLLIVTALIGVIVTIAGWLWGIGPVANGRLRAGNT